MTPPSLLPTASLLLTLDLIGTFVFALSGAASGVKNKLDVFGVGVLAFVAGNAGGVTRDVLIGAVPPAAIQDWRYVAVSLAAGGSRSCGIGTSHHFIESCCCSMPRDLRCSPWPARKRRWRSGSIRWSPRCSGC
jgi:hypothetical protein